MTVKVDPTYDFAVLGGGWAGLLAARELTRRTPGSSVIVLERESRAQAGGLLRSVQIDGFTFDCGGPHILFSKYPETLAEVRSILGENVIALPRRNFVLFEDNLIPYPFENGIFRLTPETRSRIGGGIIEAAIDRAGHPDWAPANLRDWIFGVFGAAMAEEYLVPYNSKIWKRPLEDLSADWIFTPGRLPIPEISEIARAIAGIESVGYKEQAQFIYPRKGGIQSLYDALLELIEGSSAEVRFTAPVTSLARTEGKWVVNEDIRAKFLVNTLPLPELISMIPASSALSDVKSKFDYNRVVVVGVALNRPDPCQTAVYVPNPKVPFHRYTWMSYLNPVDKGCSNLIAEVTIPKGAHFHANSVSRAVLDGLREINVFKRSEDVILTRTWINEFGYPVYRIGDRELRAQVLHRLIDMGIYSVGRWGSWEYWNTDMVLRNVESVMGKISVAENSD